MSDQERILYTAIATLLGGLLLLIAGEFVKTLVILPLQKYREQVQLALDRVDFYSNRLTNHFPAVPNQSERELISQIRNDLRSAATQLSSKYSVISWKKILVWLWVIPSPAAIGKAYSALMYLHNSILFVGEVDKYNNSRINNDRIIEVKTALHFPYGTELEEVNSPPQN